MPRVKLVEEYFDGAPAVDIHNHIRQSGLSLEGVWNTQKWHHRMYASLFGIIEANSYLAFRYFKRNLTVKHSDFTEALALQLIHNPWNAGDAQPEGTHEEPLLPRQVAIPVQADQRRLEGNHTLIALSQNDGRQRVQRKCIICSRLHRRQQKASYRCSACGERAVMCSPTTGRNCFTHHIQHGIPP